MPGILRSSSRKSDSSNGSIPPGYFAIPSRQNSVKFREPATTFTPPTTARGLPGPTPYRHLQGVPPSRYPHPPSPPYPPYAHQGYPTTAPSAAGIRSVPVPVLAAGAPVPQLPRLNPLIEAAKSPLLDFDVKYHPSTIITSSPYRSGSGSFSARFDEPATTPPVSYMKLLSPYLGTKWAIRINAAPGRFVSVNDVLYAVYTNVNLAIAKEDMDMLALRDQEKVAKAYGKRCNSIKDPKAASRERASGVRRVDFLNGRTLFVGLSPSEYGPTVWTLHLK